jgi:hypothetical protein
MRSLLRWLSPLVFLLAHALTVLAQSTMPGEGDKEPASTPALPYAIAVLCALLVLFIVCKPSRKS